jgi:hypothetical protein
VTELNLRVVDAKYGALTVTQQELFTDTADTTPIIEDGARTLRHVAQNGVAKELRLELPPLIYGERVDVANHRAARDGEIGVLKITHPTPH